MKLAIAIPALNEEDSIESIVDRALGAREYIANNSPVTEIDIIVVSDGSTDRTVERASKFGEKIKLIVFPKNRGYGAAIKTAWLSSDADLLGFLDADGTCEPKFFANLCTTLSKDKLDVVLGCRLNKESKMPLLRHVGNFIFATLLSVLSQSKVRDTASGMRVVRRSSLDHLFPLPDGLHFTPAMSARAMLSGGLRIGEVDMPYFERVGESKLRVVKDGLRFLRVILTAAFLYQPSRPITIVGIVCTAFAALLMISPSLYYLEHKSVLDWMLYRFLVALTAGTAASLCFSTAYVCKQVVNIALMEEMTMPPGGLERKSSGFFTSWAWLASVIALLAVGGVLVLGSFLEWWQTGKTYEHWSRFVLMTFCFTVATEIALTKGVDEVLDLVRERTLYWRGRAS